MILSDQAFTLHYPAGTVTGTANLSPNSRDGKRDHHSEGAPGTGKTSYLRHLMGQLRDTHRFYFIPPNSLEILEEPEFIGFWSAERVSNSDRKLVVIMEDAEEALLSRESDNREKVSAILNLSDGMLSDFICLHVICTINCHGSRY